LKVEDELDCKVNPSSQGHYRVVTLKFLEASQYVAWTEQKAVAAGELGEAGGVGSLETAWSSNNFDGDNMQPDGDIAPNTW